MEKNSFTRLVTDISILIEKRIITHRESSVLLNISRNNQYTHHKKVTPKKISEETGIEAKNLRKVLKSLKEKKLIKKINNEYIIWSEKLDNDLSTNVDNQKKGGSNRPPKRGSNRPPLGGQNDPPSLSYINRNFNRNYSRNPKPPVNNEEKEEEVKICERDSSLSSSSFFLFFEQYKKGHGPHVAKNEKKTKEKFLSNNFTEKEFKDIMCWIVTEQEINKSNKEVGVNNNYWKSADKFLEEKMWNKKHTELKKGAKAVSTAEPCKHDDCSGFGYYRSLAGKVVCDVCFVGYHEAATECRDKDISVKHMGMHGQVSENASEAIKSIVSMLH